jgi:cellulose synthase/poly-beta-1,6-N-acetylglucosamine synthase-like glycosyltransferase
VDEWRAKGVNVKQVRRPERKGFKAGALQYGLGEAKGDFIAIFDADFLPEPEFLKQTVPYFQDQGVGVVQACWGHINEDYSLLTKMQAFGLNAHFTVEQTGRNQGGHFLNFNGTAGVWRKACIEDAGGWQSDTITEDLDLSYRAQLNGWRIQYVQDIVAPAELPAAMNAFKSQQFRWTKGAAETFRKHFRNVLRADLPLPTKVHAAFHLLNSALFICIVCCSVLSVPTLIIKHNSPELKLLFQISSGFVVSFLVLTMFYWNAMRREYSDRLEAAITFIPKFLLFLSVSMGLSLHNAIAVLEGYMGRKTPFVRTPKFNLRERGDNWKHTQYLRQGLRSISPITLLEGAMAVYFGWGMYLGMTLEDMGLFPFHAMLTVGFSLVFFYSIRHARG